MRRTLLLGCLGCLIGWVFPVRAEEWRPVNRSAAQAASLPSRPASSTVQLGAPVPRNAPVASATSAPVQRTSYLAAPAGGTGVTPVALAVRAQSPDAGATLGPPPGPPPVVGPGPGMSPDEQYNCGVVGESVRPPLGQPVSPRYPWSGLFGNGPTLHSDRCFPSFISPVTNPFFFEDPRALTELRPIFIYQRSPRDNPLFVGGDTEFFGLQARLAVTENFSFVIHKLGLIAIQPDGIGPTALDDDSSVSELQLGAKWTFYRNDATNTLAALGLNFELPIGKDEVFQDTGSGALTPYISAGQKLGNFHVLGAMGYRFRFDSDRSESLFTSLHLDYSIFDRFYPLVELNWYHYTRDGKNLVADFEGQDLFNLGSTNVDGNDVITMAAGLRVKITDAVQTGMAVEFPITGRDDLMDYRITLDLIYRF